jgi:hypothetical protein
LTVDSSLALVVAAFGVSLVAYSGWLVALVAAVD